MRKCLFWVLCLCFTISLQAQEELIISNQKAGKIGSQIKKECYGTLKKLKVVGLLNNKDLNLLTNLSCLEELDLSEADLLREDYKSGTLAYYDDDYKLCLPISSLQHFIPNSLYFKVNYKESFPNLKHLTIKVNTPTLSMFENGGVDVEVLSIVILPNGRTRLTSLDNYQYTPNRDFLNLSRWDLGNGKAVLEKKMNNPIRAKILELPSFITLMGDGNFDSHALSENVSPNFIRCIKENITILNQWNDTFDMQELNNIDSLAIGAFANCSFSEISLPANIKSIPQFCFDNCVNLKKINLKYVEDIGDYAFSGTAIDLFTIPASVSRFSTKAFDNSKIRKVKLVKNIAPMVYETIYSQSNIHKSVNPGTRIKNENLRFFIPQGSASAYKSGAWEHLNLRQYSSDSDL